jgi:uncharacterized protein YceH (UPF0502 family)
VEEVEGLEASQEIEQEPAEQGPDLTPVEARVLACLMEKELTTPDNYPLTLNSLTLACNQKSNREPVMKLTQGEVGHTLRELEERDLVRVDYGDRADKYRHRMKVAYFLNPQQQAILAVLMLRKPQTLNELRSRTERMANFDGVEEVLVVVDELLERAKPFVVCIPKGPGRREDRYAQTLCGPVDPALLESDTRPARAAAVAVEDGGRIEALEQRIEALEAQLAELKERLDGPAEAREVG